MTSAKQNRSILLDQLRGFAIILMVIFHFAYDLNYFRFVEIDFFANTFWFYFPRFITFLFLLCVGMSLTIVHYPMIQWKKVLERSAILVFWSSVITATTYFLFAERFIYFGILHCIALSSIAGLAFLRYPIVSIIIGLPMLILGVFFNLNLPWFNLPQPAIDYIPFFPWFGAVLIGIFFGRNGLTQLKSENRALNVLSFLGKYSLRIYLLHQPILFGLTYLAWRFIPAFK